MGRGALLFVTAYQQCTRISALRLNPGPADRCALFTSPAFIAFDRAFHALVRKVRRPCRFLVYVDECWVSPF